MDKLDALIQALSQAETSTDTYNPYAHGNANNDTRRHNLRLYLTQMAARKPSTLLVAEAPGYRGCRITGIPVTSRAVLLEGIPSLDLFGVGRGYLNSNDAGFENIQREQSATILWSTLAQYPSPPLLWNTFPFHPHQPDTPLSNRTPRRAEVDAGKIYLRAILAIFDFKRVVAVGNVADSALRLLGVECVKVRHPAQGGKNDFVRGISEVMGT